MDQNPVLDNTAAQPQAPQTTELIGALDEALAPLPQIALDVAEKIGEAQNVLVALSSDPSVDEMAAAIGLSLFLDKLGKRATAIYSGTTPNALQFLKPEETFEATADTLQDFVIALNKDKADHLRYKLDGDYVKIFITPYKTRVSQDDLTFSYGDYNVDLVLALDVANGIDLDSALREHGRIMHDAVIVNITTGNPGKLGEIEWSDKAASSVSEMVAKLIYGVGKNKVEKDEATAFLTGIVAATNRFSNAKTTPETMQVASLLMRSGANQQLVSKNITPDVDNELLAALKDSASVKTENAESSAAPVAAAGAVATADAAIASDATAAAEAAPSVAAEAVVEEDPTELKVAHEAENAAKAEPVAAEVAPEATPTVEPASTVEPTPSVESAPTAEAAPTIEPMPSVESAPTTETTGATEPVASVAESVSPVVESEPKIETDTDAKATEEEKAAADLLDDLKEAEASLAQAGSEAVLEVPVQPVKIEEIDESESSNSGFLAAEEEPKPEEEGLLKSGPEKVLQPIDDLSADTMVEDTTKYGEMLQEALGQTSGTAENAAQTAAGATQPEANAAQPAANAAQPVAALSNNPALAMAPEVATNPEINGVPEINFTPAADAEILPPPPTPPVDLSNPTLIPPDATATAGGVEMPATNDSMETSNAKPIAPAAPTAESTPSAASAAEPTGQAAPQAAPDAFKIPGM